MEIKRKNMEPDSTNPLRMVAVMFVSSTILVASQFISKQPWAEYYSINGTTFIFDSRVVSPISSDEKPASYAEILITTSVDKLFDTSGVSRKEGEVLISIGKENDVVSPQVAFERLILNRKITISHTSPFRGPYGREYVWEDLPDLQLERLKDNSGKASRNYYLRMAGTLPDLFGICVHSLPQFNFERCEFNRTLSTGLNYKISFYEEYIGQWWELDAAVRKYLQAAIQH